MEKFQRHSGIVAPLIRLNIDTDTIIPSREMKSVSKVGLSAGLFAGWRYTDSKSRALDRNFILNNEPFDQASILLGGNNFGCGSSREHAVWALKEFGFRAIIAPSFGSIFYNNCIQNGLLPIRLSEQTIQTLEAVVLQNPGNNKLEIDLFEQALAFPGRQAFSFEIDPRHKHILLEGLDPISLTLQNKSEIDQFEDEYRARFPWAFLPG